MENIEDIKDALENEPLQEDVSVENEETIENTEKETEETETADENKKGGFFSKKDKSQKKPKNEEVIAQLKTENAELQDKFLRLYSEFDNYRKRTQKEKLDIIKNASENLIVALLPVLDDMERAVKYAAKPDADAAAIHEGEQLILQKIKGLLKQKGLTPIETENAKFDTDFHEAVSMVPASSEEEKGMILEEVEKGYMLNEKVIRFSKVVIYQ
ncbi:MAG: nucleotide exchange factor GrpE [Lentimicrobiaceae bacterium]|nr:nucleotide exchange factor GrpE [Lentimicrobiaceae bacterium]